MSERRNKKLLVILSLLLSFVLGCHNDRSDVAADVKPSPAATKDPTVLSKQRPLKLLPVDEASQDPTFEKFRNRLLTAVKNHDKTFILGVLDAHILNSLGGSGGIKEFQERWKLDHGGDELWPTVNRILSNGGSFSTAQGEKQFCAPYVTSKWREVYDLLPSDSDPSEFEAVIHNRVDLRSEPSSDSPLIGTLSYDVVKVFQDSDTTPEGGASSAKWVKVSTVTGTVGYVESRNLRSPSDYYACFKKVGSSWVMTALAAGD